MTTDNEAPKPARKRRMARTAVLRAIRAKHGSVTAFARAIEKPQSTVYEVAVGNHTSQGIAAAIAELVGRAPHQIWPDRYAENGAPIYRTRRLTKAS